MITIAVDIDGILTKETRGFSEYEYLNRTPRQENINILNDYYNRGYEIILYSSRHLEDLNITKLWLNKYNVSYHKIYLEKPHADLYIDDLAGNDLYKEVLCLSGGLDSIIAYFYLKHPQPLYFKLGHRYEKKELNSIRNLEKLIPDFNPIYIDNLKLGEWEYGDNAYIPMRNLLIATMASMYGDKIYIVGIKGDRVGDKSPEAFDIMSFAMNFIKKSDRKKIEIASPFWKMTKSDIIEWFLQNVDNAEEIMRTSVSCYDEKTLGQCGACPSCFRKWIALEVNGVNCKDWFENDITKWEGIEYYKNNLSLYDIDRQKEMKIIFEKYGL